MERCPHFMCKKVYSGTQQSVLNTMVSLFQWCPLGRVPLYCSVMGCSSQSVSWEYKLFCKLVESLSYCLLIRAGCPSPVLAPQAHQFAGSVVTSPGEKLFINLGHVRLCSHLCCTLPYLANSPPVHICVGVPQT